MSAPVIDIRTQLVASIVARTGVPAGRTVGQFCEALLTFGADTPLASVEFGCKQNGNHRLTAELAEDGLEIREGDV